jgi:hypothetical protein
MTEKEAIKVFDGLRIAYRQMNAGDDLRALRTLLGARVLPGALGTPFILALETFRLAFDELDRWEHSRSGRN